VLKLVKIYKNQVPKAEMFYKFKYTKNIFNPLIIYSCCFALAMPIVTITFVILENPINYKLVTHPYENNNLNNIIRCFIILATL